MMEIVREHLEEGDIDWALKFALDAENSLVAVEILSLVLKYVKTVEDYDSVLNLIDEQIGSINEPLDKVRALSTAAEALYTTGAEKLGWRYFELAANAAGKIQVSKWRAEAFAHIAHMMILAGLVNDAYHYYSRALETIEKSGEPYSVVVPLLSKLAGDIIDGADNVRDGRVLKFYRLARDIYLLTNKRLTASTVEDKIRTIEDVLKEGNVAITKFLGMGDIDRAIFAVKYLQDDEKPVALMNVAYWLFLHGNERLARILLKDAYDMIFLQGIRPADIVLEGMAYRFIKLGLLDDALNIAGIIRNEKRSEEILGRIALVYARRGEEEKAEAVLGAIRSESVKSRTLKAIKGERDVGHE